MAQQRAGFCRLVRSSLAGPWGGVGGGAAISLTPGWQLGAWNKLSFANPCSH